MKHKSKILLPQRFIFNKYKININKKFKNKHKNIMIPCKYKIIK